MHRLPYHILDAIRRRWPVFALLSLYLYLTVHMLSGSQGLMQWVEHEDKAVRLQSQLEMLQRTHTALEGDANALSSSALQLDRLDQAARRVLWASRESELVIPMGE